MHTIISALTALQLREGIRCLRQPTFHLSKITGGLFVLRLQIGQHSFHALWLVPGGYEPGALPDAWNDQ